MRRKISMLAVVLVALAAGAQQAGAQSAFGFNAGVGPTIPIGEGKSTGFHALVGLGLTPAAFPVGFRVEGLYQQIPEGNDDHHEYMAGILNAVLAVPVTGLSPYIIGGLGFYRHEEHHGDHTHGAHTDLGFNVGLGTKLRVAGFGFFVEARYHGLFNGDDEGQGQGHRGDSFVPLTVGISF
jgi:opacity protein-like surface antigen